MKIGRRIFLAAAVSAALCARALADVSVSASADKNQVALNDSVRVLVTVAGDAANLPSPQMPDLSAFSVYSSGRAQNVSFVNGQVSSSINYTYMLAPKSLGRFTIGPFTVTHDGKTAQSSPISIEVVAAGQPSAPASAPSAQAAPQRSNAQAPGAFVKMSVDKSKALVNEQVTLAFRFYNRVRLISNPSYQPPDKAGFLSEDLPPPRNFTESVNGVPYNVTEIKTALFPTRDGALTLSPATLKIQVQDFSGGSPDDFFEQFFRGGAREYLLKTDPVKLTVAPLPASGKPGDFSGGVGEFDVSIAADKKSAAVGEPLTLTLTVKGKGNIKSIGDPAFPEFTGFRKYDTASSLNIDTSRGTVEGSKVYKIVLVPQTSGSHNIPSIRFSYFHIPSRSYRTAATQPVTITVAPGKTQSFVVGPGAAAPQIASVSREISYIKQDPDALKRFTWFNKTPLFLILHLLPALGLIAGIGRRARIAWIARDPERRRAEGALRKWNAAVKTVRPQDENVDGKLFQAFQDYFLDKMRSREPSVSLKSAAAFLSANGIDAALSARLRSAWSQFELASYAPAQFRPQDKDRLTEEAQRLLEDIDEALRSAGRRGVKKLAALLIPLLLAATTVTAAATIETATAQPLNAQEAFKDANAQYQAGQFESAKALYESLAAESGPNFALEYNLGNAYHKLGMNGKATAHWLRARRMNPSDADVKNNLRLVGAQTGETFEPESFLSRVLYRITHALNLNQLSVLYLAAFWGLCLHWTILLFSSGPALRVRGLLTAAAFSIFLLWWSARLHSEQIQTEAVITQQSAEVRSGPGQQFRVGFTVPEGRRVLILNESTDPDWIEIGIPKAGVRGWVIKNAFDKI